MKLLVASSAGISPEESGGGKSFFSERIRRLKPIERPSEEAKLLVVNIYICIYIIALYLLLLLHFQMILHKFFKGNRLKTILTR
jgi:hypothetical protein